MALAKTPEMVNLEPGKSISWDFPALQKVAQNGQKMKCLKSPKMHSYGHHFEKRVPRVLTIFGSLANVQKWPQSPKK